ncbi:MAG: phosphoribosylaminoimidazolesuccinocarboxamide synthase [Minisyncoccia bacterium]
MAILEGKTKQVVPIHAARLIAKDDLTAGNGVKHDILPGKGILATHTTCNVFMLLFECGLPLAYLGCDTETSFVAYLCDMLPFEVVVRSEAHGSYLKRNPQVVKGEKFSLPLVEIYLKTKDRTYRGHDLECDDPMIISASYEHEAHLYNPAVAFEGAEPFLSLPTEEVPGLNEAGSMATRATRAFLALEKAWWLLGYRLVDLKLEFGIAREDGHDDLLIADVIDNDSWRLLDSEGAYLDKQIYRDGGSLEVVHANYERVAGLTNEFRAEYVRKAARKVTQNPFPSYACRF